MTQRSIAGSVSSRIQCQPSIADSDLNLRAVLAFLLAIAAFLALGMGARAQAPGSTPDGAAQVAGPQTTTAPSGVEQSGATAAGVTPTAAAAHQSANISNLPAGKTRKQKEDKVVETKDSKKEDAKYKKDNPLEGMSSKLPDKELYDKAQDSIKHGRYDVARLDLQTLLNTYPDSEFMMRAKLAIADSWYKEGGTAALTQAEQEYRDFITFFPNAPEAAEAQMRIGDIYFREMDKPDRDHSKAVHAEEEYRLMLQQFPESARVPEAAQRLREVQESLASADADVAAFYASRLNWAAAIARYQTVADTYPLYSHMDDVLVGLGDAYEAEARYYRTLKLPEDVKARLVAIYDNQAADVWRKVVLEHSAAPHVEDARDRLATLNLPIPSPTPEQAAASVALENSRGQYTLSKRAELLFLHKADTVPAATSGAPPLEDPKATLAPDIINQAQNNFRIAANPAANAPPIVATATPPAASSQSAEQAPAPAVAAPLEFQDVPTAANGAGASTVVTSIQPAASVPQAGAVSGVGVEIVQPSPGSSGVPATAMPPGSTPAFPGATSPSPAATTPAPVAAAVSNDDNGGIKPVGPTNTAVLPPVEKAASAPDTINDVIPGSQPLAQTASANGKKPKPALDKKDESSSKHKPKKGLAKLNPF
jgi:outer membrane protein assembly factor BamD